MRKFTAIFFFVFVSVFAVSAQKILYLKDEDSEPWPRIVIQDAVQENIDKGLSNMKEAYNLTDEQIEKKEDFAGISKERLSELHKYTIFCWSSSRHKRGFFLITVAFDNILGATENIKMYQNIRAYADNDMTLYHLRESYQECLIKVRDYEYEEAVRKEYMEKINR